MQRGIVASLVSMMLMTIICSQVQGADLLSDGFNSYANGAPPVPPWTEFYAGPGSTPVYTREQAAARGVTINVQDSVSCPSDPPKSVHFLDTNGQVDSRLSIQFPSASSVTLTYCMRTDNANYEGVFVELTGDVGRDYSATFSNGAGGGRPGYIGIHGSTGWVKRDLLPYTTGTWYEVRRVLDYTANIGTFYLKDLATQQEVSWQIGRDEANSQVNGILMWTSVSQGADTYIDCVRVTPEPATLLLLALGGLATLRRRR